jgi:hypothetical protein
MSFTQKNSIESLMDLNLNEPHYDHLIEFIRNKNINSNQIFEKLKVKAYNTSK